MKKYFLKLPYFIKYSIINIYGFLLYKKRYNKEFYRVLSEYKKKDKIEFLSFNSKSFKKQLLNNNFFNNEFNNINDYPIVNKQVIKQYYDEIINKSEVSDYMYTSGTSGVGLKFPVSKEFINHQWAIFWKFRNMHGITLDTWCANIISQSIFVIEQDKPPFWIKSHATNQLLFSLSHMRASTIVSYMKAIKSNNISWMHAFPSVLNNFANIIRENNLLFESKKMNLKIITTSSEKLFDYQKENIENVFGCKVRELYGLTEGVVNIFTCENGTLHIDESYSYVELVPIKNTDEFNIIGTSYHNSAFPLVRYDTGDRCIVYPDEFVCKCGRKSRTIKEILGRSDDYLHLANGTKLGRVSSIFKSLTAIKEAQIFQNKVGEAQFRIVKDRSYAEKDEKKLKQKIIEKLGNSFVFEIVYVSNIGKTKSGKLKLVVNEVNIHG